MTGPGRPLSAGSISLRLYPHVGLPAEEMVRELRHQAVLAAQAGFDGVMTSEHHGGFPGYLPNPVQAAGWLLESTPSGWAAPCPLLLPLRPPALVAEEVAWLAARFPGRVGVGLAAGSLADDFEIMGLDQVDLPRRFAAGLGVVSGMLRGESLGPLADDPAIRHCRRSPVPVVSAAMSAAAVRRAAQMGIGVLFDSLSTTGRARQLTDQFRDAGGVGPTVLIRRVWVGPAPTTEMARQLDVYRGYAAAAAQSHWSGDELIADGRAEVVAERLASALLAAGASALNLRVHVPGIAPVAVRDQIGALTDVVAQLRPMLG